MAVIAPWLLTVGYYLANYQADSYKSTAAGNNNSGPK